MNRLRLEMLYFILIIILLDTTLTLAFAFTFAGIALAMGLIGIFTGIHKDGEKTDLIFGILCLLQFFFLVLPPVGFVLIDRAPYPASLLIKRVFNYSFFSAFPWFIYYYTGYRKKILPITINVVTIITYLLMALPREEKHVPIYSYPALAGLALILIHGFLGMSWQYKNGEKQEAKWLRFALFIFLGIYICSTIFQFGHDFFSRILGIKIFFPLNLAPVSFIIIMGIRIRKHSIEKIQLERALGLRKQQWESLLNNIQLIVVHLDKTGHIKYINPYAIRILQYDHVTDLQGKNWYDYFLPGPEVDAMKNLIEKAGRKQGPESFFKNSIVTKEGNEKVITWNNEPIFDEQGNLTGIMNIGSDVTEQEMAFQRIQELKSDLEKENLQLRGEPLPDWMLQEIIGRSQAISYAIQKAGKVAASHASVLLQGETGVGKELFADLIHRQSSRNMSPFIKVNCSALPAELIEDELFGHEKGAFTGAVQSRKGRFEIADGGTIFLDEIGELPLSLQPKLLRVLQNGEFERVGGQQSIKVDVRVIAATNRDLELQVKEGKFRDDLFYRLNVYPITIPPLRARKEDIPMLLQFYVDKKSKEHGKSFRSISKADLNHLCEYDWPGNIRELKNVIERSVISSDSDNQLRLDWFYEGLKTKTSIKSMASLEEMEKEYILKALIETNWRISGQKGAAEKLAMNANTLRSRIKKLNINRPKGTELI